MSHEGCCLHLSRVAAALVVLAQLGEHGLAHAAQAGAKAHVQLLQLERGAGAQQRVQAVLEGVEGCVRAGVQAQLSHARQVVSDQVRAVLAVRLHRDA